MSSRARTALHASLALAPAVVMGVLLALWGHKISAGVTAALTRDAVYVQGATHDYIVPERAWGDKIPVFVEKFLSRFPQDQPFRGALKPLTKRLTIEVMSDSDRFRGAAFGETGNSLRYNGGYFLESRSRILIDGSGETPDSLGPTLSHELTHAIMRYSFPTNPSWSPWLSEGFAQWCEISSADAKIGTQRNVTKLRHAGESPQKDSLMRILKATHADFSGAGNDWYYNASYALVTFLLENEDLREGLVRYFALEADGRAVDSPTEFNRIVAKGDVSAVERRWIEWLQKQR